MKKAAQTLQLSVVQAWVARLERSQKIFLLGLIVAFAAEIIVDWNSTFYEIKVLRAAQREKATHFAAILRLAAEEAVNEARNGRDQGRLSALARRVLEDEEVAFVRFTDATGAVLAEEGSPLAARFPRQLERDARYMLADPEDLRTKIAASRHRDAIQIIFDTQDRLLSAIVPGGIEPPKIKASERSLAYQDRLYDEATREEDRSVTWALGLIEGAPPKGLVLVALHMDKVQAATQKKLLKGAAITLFFLSVIFVQQLSARREKLRFLSLRDALAAARTALRAALPEAPPKLEGLDGALAFEQAERLGGTVYDFAKVPGRPRAFDVFMGLPEGSGVDVALASVYVRDEQRRLREEGLEGDPEALLSAFARAYAKAPIHRRLSALFLCVDLDAGEVRGASCGGGLPVVFDSNSAEVALAAAPLALPEGAEGAMLDAPIQGFRAPFAQGGALVFYSDGLAEGAKHPVASAEVRARALAWVGGQEREARAIVDELRGLTMKRAPEPSDDILILALRRT